MSMKLVLFAAACLVALATAASAETLAVDLTPDPHNPASPRRPPTTLAFSGTSWVSTSRLQARKRRNGWDGAQHSLAALTLPPSVSYQNIELHAA
jgi:hypothetical protein